MLREMLLGFALVLATACCGTDATTTTNGAPDGGGGSSSANETKAADANGCCPRDTTQSGCMNLGGAVPERSSQCFQTCDFWCSTNWRVEKDVKGCEIWRYDVKAPEPDQTSLCQPKPDGGQ